jgi:hypothetical protein
MLSTWLNRFISSAIPRLRHRAQFRSAWGQQTQDSDGWLASRSFDLLRTQSNAEWVDDRTWEDLELPRIFAELNSTITPIGRQYLYKQLRRYEFDDNTSRRRMSDYQTLISNSLLREQLQLALKPLEVDATANIADMILGPPPEKPRYCGLINTWSVLCLLVLIATLTLSLSLWIVGFVLGVNAFTLLIISSKYARNAQILVACSSMLGVADKLATISTDKHLSPLGQLVSEGPKRAAIRGDVWWLTLLAGNAALSGIALAAELLFLAKIVSYCRTVDKFVRSRPAWVSTFELIGAIDAYIAVANYLHRTPTYCRPEISTRALISIESGCHPLLSRPVRHSITLDGRSALVTGSNMAGKTTFVKMVGTNILFGHTLGFCLASSATIPRSGVMTSIRGGQSVESGKSRYFSEVEAIRDFIDSASRGECGVFIIDEIFSGTNTTERVAAAMAVLLAISQRAQVLATTHDVELQPLLADQFDPFYFQENPAIPGFFDYKLHIGVSTERNAIRVLERLGFPAAIIQEANSQATRNKG